MTAVFDGEAVARDLGYTACARRLEEAMIALSTTAREQPLRTIIPMAPAKLFALMPGSLPVFGLVGAKVITAYPEAPGSQRSKHRGMVLGFDSDSGDLLGMGDAHEITLNRTAVASAVATRAMARAGARSLTIMGAGAQARSHVRAFAELLELDAITIWSRDIATARALADELSGELDMAVIAQADGRTAVAEADIVTTVTGAPTPILWNEWVRPGTHVNLVGSSHAGPYEADPELVARARFVADCRPYALVAAAEFLVARDAGLIDESHIVGEIGQVLNGEIPGREDDEQVTIYKSLGHVVQDLAALKCLLDGSPQP